MIRKAVFPLAGLFLMTQAAYLTRAAAWSNDPMDSRDAVAPAKAADPLAALSWMQGTWSRTQNDEYLEESWSAPAGDCMQGMFRWLKGGKLWMVELMTITVEDGTPVFRIRHFDRRQVAWESKSGAIPYALKSSSESEVRFENPDHEKTRGFAFSQPSPDEYEVRILPASGAKGRETAFRFKRKAD